MATTYTSPKARVDFRTTGEIRSLLEHAATLQGMTLAEFAKYTLVREANQVIAEHETRTLSDRDRDRFLALLDEPPAPNEALLAAAEDVKRAVQEGRLKP